MRKARSMLAILLAATMLIASCGGACRVVTRTAPKLWDDVVDAFVSKEAIRQNSQVIDYMRSELNKMSQDKQGKWVQDFQAMLREPPTSAYDPDRLDQLFMLPEKPAPEKLVFIKQIIVERKIRVMETDELAFTYHDDGSFDIAFKRGDRELPWPLRNCKLVESVCVSEAGFNLAAGCEDVSLNLSVSERLDLAIDLLGKTLASTDTRRAL